MTSFITKFVAKKILGESVKNKFGKEDPYFETVPATRIDGKIIPGKTKRQRKALPPGISEQDGQVLTKVKRRAYRLDLALFSLCGVRFGWSSAIGFIPVIGDVLDVMLALLVLKTCRNIEGGLPMAIQIRMLMNIAFDFLVGIVPFAGDILDALFRANTRNAIILEEHLRERGRQNLKKAGKPIPDVDPSEGAFYDNHPEEAPVSDAPAPQASMRDERGPQTRRDERDPQPRRDDGPAVPAATHAKQGPGWWNRSQSRPADVETGQSRAV